MKICSALIGLTVFSSAAFADSTEHYYDRIDTDDGIEYVINENGKYLETYDNDTARYMYSPRLSQDWLLGPTLKEAEAQGISSNFEYCKQQGEYHPPTQKDMDYLLFSLKKEDPFAKKILQGLGWTEMGSLEYSSRLLNNETQESYWRVVWLYDATVGESSAQYLIETNDVDSKTRYSCAPNL